jgi:hypothetical protein
VKVGRGLVEPFTLSGPTLFQIEEAGVQHQQNQATNVASELVLQRTGWTGQCAGGRIGGEALA